MSHRIIRTHRIAVLSLAGLAMVVLTGCQNPASPWSRDGRIRANLTPELRTLDQTHIDTKNQSALMVSENMRMAYDDLLKVFYLDRPSRLTQLPMPH